MQLKNLEICKIKQLNTNNMNTEEKKIVMIQAIEAYGFDSQLDQLTEELGELIVACNKFRRKAKDCGNNLADEMADVEIMIEQIKFALNLGNQVELRKDYKLERLKNRINGN